MTETDKLIMEMVNEGAAKPLLHPTKQTAIWFVGTLIYMGSLILYSGLRIDITDKLLDIFYVLELLSLFGIAISSALSAFYLSRPDGHQKPWAKYVLLGFVLFWIVTAFIKIIGPIDLDYIFNSIILGRFDCPWHIFLFSIPPGIAMFWVVRMGATINYFWAGSMATLSVTSLGYMLMRLIEQNDNPSHLIIWHALPVIIMCFMGVIIGKHALKWK